MDRTLRKCVAMPSLLRITGIYALYTHRLRGQYLAGRLPGHVRLIMDGNRRWARQAGLANPSLGHRATARALKDAVEATRGCTTGAHVTLAVGYGGRQEIIDAVRNLLTADDITAHLYTIGRPEPDLVIRTSGEQRLSNFLLWQSAYSELYFCEAYWPAFREIDFLRALRSYAARKRRFGT
jgi:undecaprenyl pyrophosphate synthase